MANQWTNQSQKNWYAKQSEGQLAQDIEEVENIKFSMIAVICAIGCTDSVTSFVSFKKARNILCFFSSVDYLSEDCFKHLLREEEKSESITVNWEANSYRTIY